jgi:uncharacterized membrane protein YccC
MERSHTAEKTMEFNSPSCSEPSVEESIQQAEAVSESAERLAALTKDWSREVAERNAQDEGAAVVRAMRDATQALVEEAERLEAERERERVYLCDLLEEARELKQVVHRLITRLEGEYACRPGETA